MSVYQHFVSCCKDFGITNIEQSLDKMLVLDYIIANENKSIYNKMTKYFTINVEREGRKFCGAHYGTEIYLIGVSDDDIAFYRNVMKTYTEEDFSMAID